MRFGWFRRRDDIILYYNGQRYELESGDIPGLSGSGTIIVVNTLGRQSQETEGNFENIVCEQINRDVYVNGVNLANLVERLKEQKRAGG